MRKARKGVPLGLKRRTLRAGAAWSLGTNRAEGSKVGPHTARRRAAMWTHMAAGPSDPGLCEHMLWAHCCEGFAQQGVCARDAVPARP